MKDPPILGHMTRPRTGPPHPTLCRSSPQPVPPFRAENGSHHPHQNLFMNSELGEVGQGMKTGKDVDGITQAVWLSKSTKASQINRSGHPRNRILRSHYMLKIHGQQKTHVTKQDAEYDYIYKTCVYM